MNRKKKILKNVSGFEEDIDDEDDKLNNNYRDRALERRNEEKKQEPLPSLSTTSSFNTILLGQNSPELDREKKIEQSKYLGGDEEHTHLVLGLDYQLLNIQREKERKRKEAEEYERKLELENEKNLENDKDDEEFFLSSFIPSDQLTEKELIYRRNRIKPKTNFGNIIKNFLFSSSSSNLLSLSSSKKLNKKIFNNITYRIQFSSSIDTNDVPLTIIKSNRINKKEILYTNFVLNSNEKEKLLKILNNDGKIIKKDINIKEKEKEIEKEKEKEKDKGKEKEKEIFPSSSSTIPQRESIIPVSKKEIKIVSDSIYDDEDISEPTSSSTLASILPSAPAISTTIPTISTSKTFEDPSALYNLAICFTDDEDEERNVGGIFQSGAFTSVSTSTTVAKPLFVSSNIRSSITNVPVKRSAEDADVLLTSSSSSSRAIPTTSSLFVTPTTIPANSKIIHRDVFSSTRDKIVEAPELKKNGQKFGQFDEDSYDNYFMSGDFETYDSDEEGISQRGSKKMKGVNDDEDVDDTGRKNKQKFVSY